MNKKDQIYYQTDLSFLKSRKMSSVTWLISTIKIAHWKKDLKCEKKIEQKTCKLVQIVDMPVYAYQFSFTGFGTTNLRS